MRKLILLLTAVGFIGSVSAQNGIKQQLNESVNPTAINNKNFQKKFSSATPMQTGAVINIPGKVEVDDTTLLPLSPNGKLLSVDGYEVNFELPANPEISNICATKRPYVDVVGQPKSAGCPFTVPCDDPSNRDAAVTTTKYFQLEWHVMWDGGASSNIDQARIDDLMAELNADYASHNMIFCANPASFYEDAANYYHDSNTEEVSLKTTYNVNPTQLINIYVVGDMTAGGYARFPYDPMGGTSATGGIVLNRGNCTVGTHTLAHEMGHTFGLEHTFAGVDERSQCSACYEQVRNANGSSNTSGVATPFGGPYNTEGDQEGDWCSDTNPHDTYSYNCSTSSNPNGACDVGPWANAPVNNHMSYSFCSSQFTNQQSRRMHCMVNTYLGSWTSYGGGICGAQPPVADFVGTPTTWQAPSNVNFTDLSTPQAIITGWTWTFDVGSSGTVTCAGCTGANAQFVGQVPPVVTYPNPGLYTVSLTITSANGNDTETKVDYIEVLAPAGDCDTLTTQWETPTPTPSIYTFGGGFLTGVQDPANSVSPTDLKGMYEMFFTPNPGVTQVGAVRVGLGLLEDANDNMTFQVVVFDDDGAGAPGAVLGGVGGISPTALGVPGAGSFNEFWIPLNNAVTPTTGTFHVGVEIIPGDATDSMIVVSSAAGQGEGDNSNHIWTTGFGYENLQAVYGIDFDLDIVPMLGEWAPQPLITGFTENVVCDTTYVTLFDTVLYSSFNALSITFADGTVINTTTDPMTIPRVYTTPGPDTVTIAAINDCGRADTTTWIIPYGFLETPNSEFTASPNNPVCMGAPGVDFTANTSGYVDYTWDFGDGTAVTSSGNVETINHVYTAPGFYYVELTTTQAGYNAADTFYLEDFEGGWPAGYDRYDNDPFTPNAAVNPPFTGTNATAWLTFDIDGTGDNEAVSTSWNGGPGQPADDWMLTTGIGVLPANQRLFWDAEALDVNYPDGYEVRISTVQLPANVGNYSTLLFSTTAENAFSTTHSVDLSSYAGQTVYIAFVNNSDDMFLLSIDNIRVGTATPGCNASTLYTDFVEIIDCTVIPPTTVLNSDVTGGCGPLTVTFTDGTTAGDPADEWLWNFGDGTFSLLQNPPPHIYTNPGTYFVIFESCNDGGCTQDTVTITVGDPAVISNVATVDPSCAGNDGSITITAAGGTGALQYSIDNGVTFQASNFFNGLGAGTYDVVVEDAIGCQVTTTATLTGAAGPTISAVTGTDALCNGGSDGTIDITATGTPVLQYSIDNGVTFQAGNTFIGLTAGVYNIVVEDGTGCQATSVYTVNEPATAVAISGITSNDPTCNGLANGDIAITATGGTGALQYSIDNGLTFQAGSSFTGLGAGTYNVVVEDANGCQVTQVVTLTDPVAVSITSVTPTDPTCAGNDGQIDIVSTGGTGALQYSIDNGVTFQAGASFPGLSGGVYDVVVEDANGCQATQSVTLTALSAPTITTVTGTDPLCAGGLDGTIDITASGGTGALQYSIDNGVTFQAGNTFAGLPAGVYNIVVEDATGCQAVSIYTLADPTALTITNVASTDPSCGASDGTIDITASGGTGALQYSIDNGVTFQAGNTFAGLTAGTYNIVVEDVNGCQQTSSVTLNAAGGPSITNVTVTDPSCAGSTDGDITISATGGVPTLTYSVDNGVTFQAGNNFSGLGAATYNIVVEDGAGCQVTTTATLTDPTPVLITAITPTDPTCAGATDGSLDITASGGTGALQYSVDGGVTFQPGNVVNGLGANTYIVVVEDANGCQATQTGVLTDPTAVTYTVTITDENCGLADGVIDLVGAAGAGGPYQYSIDGGATFQGSGTFGGLTVGTYNVVVEDMNGCQTTGVETVNGTGGPTISGINEDISIVCFGDCNGQLTAAVSGGTLPYQYVWTDGTASPVGGNSATVISLCADVYTLTVTDNAGAGCATVMTFTLVEPTAIAYSVSVTDESCGNANGQIDITGAAGGSGAGYQYSIDGGVTFQASGTFAGLTASTYNVVVQDGNGCQVSSSETVNNIAGPAIMNVTSTDPTCGGANGDITITASGGTGTLQYSIDNGVTFQAGNNFTGLTAATYDIVVEDANGCQATSTVTLTDLGAPIITAVTPTDPTCGANNGQIDITAAGGTGTLQYSVDNGVTFQGPNVFTGLAANTYIVVVEDANGCQALQTVILNNSASPTISSVTTNDPTCGNANGDINITAAGGTGALQYSVDNGATFQAGNLFPGLSASTYNIVVEDANGCQATQSVTLTDIAGPSVSNVTGTDPTCGNANGQIDITATGGTGTIQYSIDNGATFQAGTMFNSLIGGVYNVVVEDANGCQSNSIITLNDPGAPIITATTTTDPSCGATNGSIIITASGGSGALQYSIDNGTTFQGTNGFSGLADATYPVLVEDAAGCQATTTVVLVDAGSPTITSLTSTDPSCGNNNGTINVAATGGAGGYQYSINGGATWSFSTNFIGLSPGGYTVIVEDVNGCQATQTVSLTQTGTPDIHIDNVIDVTCFGAADGIVNITVTGGAGPYTFDWSNDGTGDFDDPEDLTNGVPGVVSVTVVDANGCAELATAMINGPADLWATGVGNDEAFGNDGSIDLTVGGGTAPYTYSWSNGSTQQNPTGLAAGTYTVTITDANGCTFTTSVTVGSVVSLEETENPMGIVVAPNPNSGEFFITFNNYAGDVRVDIVDVAGKLVYQGHRAITMAGSIAIDISDVGAGVYFVNVSNDTDIYSTRVVKR